MKIGVSYLLARLFPRKLEKSLEDFLINRFGRQLYLTFFKSYTEKVWGVPCEAISAEWGAQRIKGLSLRKAILHHFKKLTGAGQDEISQKDTETSLIEKFLYPKLGPGQLWEEVANRVRAEGGEILTGWTVCGIQTSGNRVTGVVARNGLVAAELARAGSVSAPKAFEGKSGFAHAFARVDLDGNLAASLGHDWAILRVAFKPFRCVPSIRRRSPARWCCASNCARHRHECACA